MVVTSATSPVSIEVVPLERRRRLRIANIVVGLVMGTQALAVLALSNDLSLPVFASFLRSDPVKAQAASPATELFSLAIGPAVAVFLALAAIDHLVVAA